MSFFTSFCDLPQKEQRRVSSVRLTIAEGKLLEKSTTLLWSNHRRFGNFCASDDLVVTTDAFVTDECALAYHLPGNTRHPLRCARYNLRTFTLRSIAEGTAKTFSFHSGNHGRFSKLHLRFEISQI
jgi:hypothetical protein